MLIDIFFEERQNRFRAVTETVYKKNGVRIIVRKNLSEIFSELYRHGVAPGREIRLNRIESEEVTKWVFFSGWQDYWVRVGSIRAPAPNPSTDFVEQTTNILKKGNALTLRRETH